jgi:predicted porin
LPAYVVQATKINGVSYAAQAAPRSATCSGQLNAVSAYADYHFTKRFDIYGGIMYSVVTGGLASGFFNPNNVAPTVGLRYTF